MSLHRVDQTTLNTVADVNATEKTAAETWRALVESAGFQRELINAVRDLLQDAHHGERGLTLAEAGITAGRNGYAAVLAGLDAAPETDRHQEALATTRRFGSAETTIAGQFSLGDLTDGPLAAIEAAERAPTVAIRLGSGIRERDTEARAQLADLLAILATVCDVRLVATRLTAHWFDREHHDKLPAEFSERVRASREEASPIEERVAAARDALAPDGRAVAVLRRLADEPGQTLSRHALVSQATVSSARISQLLAQFEDLQLAERFGPRGEQRVELLPAGTAFIDVLDAESGRQSELDAEFSEAGQSSNQCRVTPRAHGEGEDGPADRTTPYRTAFLGYPAHHAAAATAAAGGITAVEAGFDEEETRTRWVSYESRRKEAVVAVRATTPLQYTVSTACALASTKFLHDALPADRLEDIDVEASVLRDARCIGGITDEAAADGKKLQEKLIEWGETLAGMTTDLRHGEYEDRDRFRGEIMRSAHGLAGSIVHLLDVAGISVTRELRVPRTVDHSEMAELAMSVSVTAAIQSHYDDCTVYRQLFEHREEKRRYAASPTVDAADPYGSLIGGFAVRGPNAKQFAGHLTAHLGRPGAVHEDAPDIALTVPVRMADRSVFAEAATRMAGERNLDMTREAVTIFRALTASPWTTTEAIYALGGEDHPRKLRLGEVRYALSALDAEKILPNCPRTTGRIAQTLLRSAGACSREAIAEKAGVSERSVRRNIGFLTALTLISEVDGEYRFALPTKEERHEDIRPAVLDDANAARQDLLFDVALILVDDRARFGNPRDPLCQAFGPTFDEELYLEAVPDAEPWVRPTRVLCNDPDRPETTVTVGETPSQTALQEVSA